MRVSIVQFAPLWEDRAGTRAKLAYIFESTPVETDWMVFPEMALSGFSMNLSATTWKDEDYQFFQSQARRKNCYLTVGAVENAQNTALVFQPDGNILARYAKRHLFSPSGESDSYQAGNSPCHYEVGDLNIAQNICYDLRFPDAFWSSAAQVNVYCIIAAWPNRRAEHWKALLRARAIENQAFVIGVNRTGSEPESNYSGDSLLIDPQGKTILDCGEKEGIFTSGIEVGLVRDWRGAFPILSDRL